MKLGFIGLGAMGTPMARNLLEAGHELAVWNRSPKRVDPLMEAGARRADSPADAASGTQATMLMVTSAEAVHEVLFGDKGVVQGLPAGAAVINMGTIGAVATTRIAETLGELGYRMLDAPVSGSTPVAAAGELAIMVGGDEQTFEEFEPVLATMGEKISHMGEVGSGARMKLINNLIMGANMAVLSEGLALGEVAGIPVEKQLEVILAGGRRLRGGAAQERELDLGLLRATVQTVARAKGPLLRPGVGTRSRGSSAHNRGGLPDLQRGDEGARRRRPERGCGGLPEQGERAARTDLSLWSPCSWLTCTT